MVRGFLALVSVATAASCSRDIALVNDPAKLDVEKVTVLDVERNISLATLNFGGLDSKFYVYGMHVSSEGKILTFGYQYNKHDEPMVLVWNTAGEKLQEVSGLWSVNIDSVKEHDCPIADPRVLSPDGHRFLSADQAANMSLSVSIRSTQSFASLCDLGVWGDVREPNGPSASFDESGNRVLTRAKTAELTIWNAHDCSEVVRIPYSGNRTSYGHSGFESVPHGSAAWAAGGALVAVIESNHWFEDDGDEGNEHVLATLKVYDAASAELAYAVDLGEVLNNEFLLISRGDVLVVATAGFYLSDTRIFNASSGTPIQDFRGRNISGKGTPRMVDIDPKGKRLLVATSFGGYGTPVKTEADGIWDVATGELQQALWVYPHDNFVGFVGDGRRLAVEKRTFHRKNKYRVQFVDVSTDKMVARWEHSEKGVYTTPYSFVYATVPAECDDSPVVV